MQQEFVLEETKKEVCREEIKILSPSQQKAAAFGDGPVLVLAGPGSGKTLVITQRILFLVKEKNVPPERILVVTFSRAAAQEMRSRFEKLCPGTHGISFGTFHGIFFQILKRAYHYTGASVLREEERFRMIEDAAGECGLDLSEQREVLSSLATEISLVKNEQICLENYYSTSCADRLFREICRRYDSALRKEHRIDFDDMLVQCLELLQQREDILRQWQKCFRYILVDEFQDINRIQYAVLRLLLKPEDNLFAVGDDDQSIYRFRGACPQIMLGFSGDYPGSGRLYLEENYRCAPTIVRSAGKVIAANRHRYPKRITALAQDGDTPLLIRCFSDAGQEASYICERIRKALKEGESAGSFAVLVRNNREGRFFAETFLRYEIPFSMKEMTAGIYDHWICKDLFAYLRLAAGQRSRGDFLRVMNHPLRYISRSCVDQERVSFDRLRYWYEEKPWMIRRLDELEEDLNYMGTMRPFAAVNYLRRHMGYEDYLKEYAGEKGIQEEDLLQILEELQESALPCATADDWLQRIDALRSALKDSSNGGPGADGTAAAKNIGKDRLDKERVLLSTLHSAKGLEFTEVFLPDLNETILPGRKARLEADIEEERRLFYVGMTRAKRRLHILYVKERFGRPLKPSRFLKELV